MSNTNDVPKWVDDNERLQKILLAFERFGLDGGTIDDVRKAAGIEPGKAGSPLAKKLIDGGLICKPPGTRDVYMLTPKGHAVAKLLGRRSSKKS